MFYPNLLFMLSAFIVLAIIIVVFSILATRRYHSRLNANSGSMENNSIPLMAAATVLGIGIGGFIDGIVLHQILQWHEMLTNKLPADTLVNKSINMFWDGIFHLFTLITTIVGVFLLWNLLHKKTINTSKYLLWAGLSMGWGLFNLVEGIIDHHLLKLHNVREWSTSQELWNHGFLIFGLLLIILGWYWQKKGASIRSPFRPEV
ncbi:putative membrane protein [Pedobacter sp. CAN_A7]|uniref:DUF2243 domain-containing protein n=1 Tax=Pedobacter sp. CAN_A7 TaxID=2787722 RepID=UPI0018CBE17E